MRVFALFGRPRTDQCSGVADRKRSTKCEHQIAGEILTKKHAAKYGSTGTKDLGHTTASSVLCSRAGLSGPNQTVSPEQSGGNIQDRVRVLTNSLQRIATDAFGVNMHRDPSPGPAEFLHRDALSAPGVTSDAQIAFRAKP